MTPAEADLRNAETPDDMAKVHKYYSEHEINKATLQLPEDMIKVIEAIDQRTAEQDLQLCRTAQEYEGIRTRYGNGRFNEAWESLITEKKKFIIELVAPKEAEKNYADDHDNPR